MSYTSFISNFAFPFHEYLKGHSSVAMMKKLESSQWWSKTQIEEEQNRKLQTFVTHLYTNVPYYQNLFNHYELRPKQIQTTADLRDIPFLTKTIIRENHDQLIARNAGPLQRLNTGGSTGEPMVFQVGKDRVSHDVAAKWRATRWWGVDIGDPELVLWGSPIELGKQDKVKLLRDRILRTRLFSAFQMTPQLIDEILRYISDKEPAMLFGYPSAFMLVAERAMETNADVSGKAKVAFVTAEKCYSYQKDTIEKIFGCRVANGYGGRDAGFIAHECPAGQLHLSAEDIIVELVDENDQIVSDGELGEIVVTHLATGDFPFLRYRTGDMAVRATTECSCGRGLPILAEIKGRSTDFVQAADGTMMHGLALIYVLRDLAGINGFKIIQKSIDHTVIQIVKAGNYESGTNERIIKEFKDRLGANVHIELTFPHEIKPENSGKFRYVVNEYLNQSALRPKDV